MSEVQNINEENSKNEIHHKDEINENISPPVTIEQPETQIEKSDITTPDIQNMEVHHHPQVEKKNFKEYLLEGLMIFLAVTMGFIAENIRENVSDHRKEMELIRSLVKDLRMMAQ